MNVVTIICIRHYDLLSSYKFFYFFIVKIAGGVVYAIQEIKYNKLMNIDESLYINWML